MKKFFDTVKKGKNIDRISGANSQSISDNNWTNVTVFETVDYDDFGGAEIGNNQIVIQQDGFYIAQFLGDWQNMSDGAEIYHRIKLNGSGGNWNGTAIDKQHLSSGTGAWHELYFEIYDYLDADDTINVEVRQISGSSQTLSSGALSVIRLG